MGRRIAEVDRYIARAEPFARPILEHLRALVHATCPGAEESIKWGMPHFGHRGLLCHMAAFKRHAAFGFWRHGQVVGGARPGGAMGSFGKLASLADLPPKREIAALLRRAMRLNESGGAARPPAQRPPRPPVRVPADLRAGLARSRAAATTWKGLAPSHRRDYVEWLTGAKTAPTRARRLATTLAWLAEGRSRNWKYAKRR